MKTKWTIIAVCLFLAGAANGWMDALQFHGAAKHFENEQFWDPQKSWVNKYARYESGDPMVGAERFWGSSRWFVAVTDGWHLLKAMNLNLMVLAVLIASTLKRDLRGWKDSWQIKPSVLICLAIVSAMKLLISVGFHLTYSIIF